MVAMHLAERFGAIIVSADARQVYRDFDVGTAKPTLEEQARVQHEGIDLVPPTVRYSAAAWSDAAAGGTGLYLRALFEPFFEEPPIDPARRRALEPLLGTLSRGELQRWCAALDPSRAWLGRTQLLRSVEVALLTGRRLSDLHAERRRPPRYRARYLLVDPGEDLHERIRGRAAWMLGDGGWVEEVERLRQSVPVDAPAWNASGYEVVRELVEGRISREAALQAIVIETRQYAKRQRTWFRHQLPPEAVTTLDPTSTGWEAAADRWWREDT